MLGLWYSKNWFKRNYPQTNLGEHSGDTAVDQSTGLSDPVSTFDSTSRQEDSGHPGTGLRRKGNNTSLNMVICPTGDLTLGNTDMEIHFECNFAADTHYTDYTYMVNLHTIKHQFIVFNRTNCKTSIGRLVRGV